MNKEIAEIAARMKDLREIAEMSAESVAEKLGIDQDLYLQYEGGTADIPMGFLFEFAKLFHVELSDILSGGMPMLRTFSFVKSGRGIAVERREHYKYQHLAYNFANKKAEPFMVMVESKDGEPIHLNSHEGQEFNYCVEGRLLIVINGQEVVMEPGDSLYFNSLTPHGMRALDGKPARFLAIIF